MASRTLTGVEMAKLAVQCGVSVPAIRQKLERGMTPPQIVAYARSKNHSKQTIANRENGRKRKPGVKPRVKKAGGASSSDSGSSGDSGDSDQVDSRALRHPNTGETSQEANLRKDVALANKTEIENKVKMRELLPVGEINAWFGGLIIRARDIIMELPELVERVRREPDDISAREMLEQQCRRALGELEKYTQLTSGGAAIEEAISKEKRKP